MVSEEKRGYRRESYLEEAKLVGNQPARHVLKAGNCDVMFCTRCLSHFVASLERFKMK